MIFNYLKLSLALAIVVLMKALYLDGKLRGEGGEEERFTKLFT